MSYIKLTLGSGNSPKVIYVPANWYGAISPPIGKEKETRDDFLRKLIIALNNKKVFDKPSTEGFYIKDLRGKDLYDRDAKGNQEFKGKEINFSLVNLMEPGVRPRPVGALVNIDSINLKDDMRVEMFDGDPMESARNKQKQRDVEAEENKRIGAQRRQLLKGKKKILLHEFVAHAKNLSQQRLKEQEQLKKDQERLKKEQEKQKVRLEAQKLMDRMKALSAVLPSRQQPVVTQVEKTELSSSGNKKLIIPDSSPENEAGAIKAVIGEFTPLLKVVRLQQNQVQALKQQLKFNGVDIGAKALSVNPELIERWKLRLAAAMQKVIDEQASVIGGQVQKIKDEFVLNLKKPVLSGDFSKIYFQVVRNYNQEHPTQLLLRESMAKLNKEIEGAYKAKGGFRLPLKLSKTYQGFEILFNEVYPKLREELERQKREEKYKELMIKVKAESVDDWIKRLKNSTTNQIFDEIQQYKDGLTKQMSVADSFKKDVQLVSQNFKGLLTETAALEEEVKKVKLTPLLRERMLEQLHYTGELLGTINSTLRDQWSKRFDVALLAVHKELKPSEDWLDKLKSNTEIKNIFNEIRLYKQDMRRFLMGAKDLEVSTDKFLPEIDKYLSQSKEIYEMMSDIKILVDNSGVDLELKYKLDALWQDVANQRILMHHDRRNMITESPKEAERILEVVRERNWPKVERAYLGSKVIAAQARALASQSKLLSPAQMDKFTNDDLELLNAQLELLDAIKKAVTDVPFWNQQVSGVRGPKIEFWDPKKEKKVSLYVPDGIGEMVNKIITNEGLSVEGKLIKIQSIAAGR